MRSALRRGNVMSDTLPKNAIEAADISAVTQLILRERESRDLARWGTMRECFWPDSLVRVSWFRGNGPDFVTGSIDMARRGIPAKHRLAPVLVRLRGDRAVASMHGIIDLPVTMKGVGATLSTHSRFLYRAEKRDGRWGLMGFDAIYMRDELIPDLPGQTVTIDAIEVKDFRKSYRLLSYYLHSQGYQVDSNLPGEDRPETAEMLYRELFGWAGLDVPK
jgi:SnoaL-like domain